MNSIMCYVENVPAGRKVPPGFRVREPSRDKTWRAWAGGQPGTQRVVYRERFQLYWDDLELVSFVLHGSARGAFCWCDLSLQLDDPELLLGGFGEVTDGQWVVTRQVLEQWFRPRMVAALEAVGGQGDLGAEDFWPKAAGGVVERLTCPSGVSLDRGGPTDDPPRPAFELRKVRSYEQFLEEITLKQELRLQIDRVLTDGTLAKAVMEGRLDAFVADLEEGRFGRLLTRAEREKPAADRVSSYIEIAGSPGEPELRPGVVIGNFQLQTVVGRGGMGELWKAWDVKGERVVALKLVPPEMQHATEDMARMKTTFQRIHALNHQHICPVYLLDEDRRFGWYLVMKYIDGQPLSTYRSTYVVRHGSFPLERVVNVLRPVAEALDYAHAHKVIHRDIKPQNILVAGDVADVQVVDFGLAAEIRSSVSRLSKSRLETSGTRPYMAPEQWRGEVQDARTDQYALAVVAYELLAGRLPFESPDFDMLRACVLNDPPRPIEGLTPSLNRALLLGLAKRPEERLGSCTEFVGALASGSRTTPTPTRGPADRPPSSRRRWNLAELLLVFALCGVVLLLLLPTQLTKRHAATTSEDARPLSVGGAIKEVATYGPVEAIRRYRALSQQTQDMDEGDVQFCETVLDFLRDRAQFLQEFPEVLEDEVRNELIPLLPETQAEAGRAAFRRPAAVYRVGDTRAIEHRGHSGDVTSIVLSKDQQLAVTTSLDETVCLWDLTEQRCLCRLEHSADHAYLAPGPLIWSVSNERVCLWEPFDGRLIRQYDLRDLMENSVNRAADLSIEGSVAVMLSSDALIWAYDLNTGSVSWQQEVPGRALCFALSKDGARVLVVCREPAEQTEDASAAARRGKAAKSAASSRGVDGQTLYVLDARNGELLSGVPVPAPEDVSCIAADRAGQTVVVGTVNGHCLVRRNSDRASTNAQWVTIGGSVTAEVESLSVSDSGSILAVRYRDPYQVQVWRLRASKDGSERVGTKGDFSTDLASMNPPARLLTVDNVFFLALVSADDRLLFVSNFSNGFSIHDIADEDDVVSVAGIPTSIDSCHLSSDGECILDYRGFKDRGSELRGFGNLAPATVSAHLFWWVHRNLAIVQRRTEEGSISAHVCSRLDEDQVFVVQKSGSEISAAAYEPVSKALFFSRAPVSSEPGATQAASIVQMRVDTGEVLAETALSAVTSALPDAKSEVAQRIQRASTVSSLWYWDKPGLLVGIAIQPAGTSDRCGIAFTLDPVRMTLRHAIELPDACWQYRDNIRFNESAGLLVLKDKDALRWYDLANEEEVGSVELPKRLAAAGPVASNKDGSLIAVAGARLGAIYDTQKKTRVFTTTFDSSVDDVGFDAETGDILFLLSRGDVIVYRRAGMTVSNRPAVK